MRFEELRTDRPVGRFLQAVYQPSRWARCWGTCRVARHSSDCREVVEIVKVTGKERTMFEDLSKRQYFAVVGALFAGGLLFLSAAIFVFTKFNIGKGEHSIAPRDSLKLELNIQAK
jgi:hypothetical protein